MLKPVLNFIIKTNNTLMLRPFTFITVFLMSGTFYLKAQDTLPAYQSKKFRSVDLNVGIGITEPLFNPIPVSIVYQQNIKRGFSWIIFSQLHAKFKTDEIYNVSYKFINWVEGAGIGGSLGNKAFNTGLYIVGGGRYYYSKLTADNSNLYNDPKLVTNKFMPEMGLLYNIKIGKKKIYFTSQLYVVMYPFENIRSNLHTFSIGVGYKFKGKD